MARRTNRQSRSVGNLGDILKHAALVELASALVRAGATVDWVETHAFLLEAPPSDPARWDREVDGLAAAHPAYGAYAARERAHLARTGLYRCSSGLALDVLGAARAAATLGEIDGVTRASLRAQLEDERHPGVVVVDEAAAALRAAAGTCADATLLHVDPFALDPADWAHLASALDDLSARATAAALVVYRYTRSAPTPWPVAPRGLRGPVAHIRGGPHEVAAYASAGLVVVVRDVCASLGWTLGPA